MATVANPELLTPNVFFQTGLRLQAADGSMPSNAETIAVSVCSEFKVHHVPATTFDARHKLSVVLDFNHHPIVFTIGNDARFYCIQHVTGRGSWTATDITPLGATSATTFDVLQYSTGETAITVAAKTTASSIPAVYYVKPFSFTSGFNPAGKIGMAFVKINNDKSVPIVSMMIAATVAEDLTKLCFIVIGTQETRSVRATDYVVSTGPQAGNQSPWTTVSIPENATKVIKVVPVIQRKPFGACIASLYQQVLAGSSPPPDVGTKISCLTLDGSYNIDVVLDKIGGGRDVSTVVDANGLSDLYVAGVKGIGYYSSYGMDEDPVVIHPDISFQQIVASEGDSKIGASDDKRKICIFALSTSGDLYYIDGSRDWADTPTFTAYPYPIRRDVGLISTQRNPAVNATETMYVNSANELKHLWRDSQTQTWSEHTIHVPSIDKAVSYPAFTAQIHLEGSRGAVIVGHDILLSATELAYVLINDTVHRLDQTPAKFTTDESGHVRIVIHAGPQLGSPTITGTIAGVGNSKYSFEVQPRQRVLRKWASIKSGSDLKNAKSTAGDPVFPNTAIHDETFNTAASLLGLTPVIIAHFGKPASTSVGGVGQPQLLFASHNTPSGRRMSFNVDWTTVAVDGLCALGDFLESVWNGVLNVAKFAVNIVGKVVNFFAEIGGKVLRWELDTIGSVIRYVSTFLKDTLDIDLTRFLACFGFLWDYPNILKTQQVIVKTVKDGAVILQDIVQINASQMKEYIKTLRSLLTPFIADKRVPKANDNSDAKQAPEKSPLVKLLKSVLNNPIINDVMRYLSLWMLKVLSIFEDQISFPGLGNLEQCLSESFTTILATLMDDADQGLVTFIGDIVKGLWDVLKGKRSIGEVISMVLSDAFWSIFDAAQNFALLLVDLVPKLVAATLEMVTGHIKLPGISAFWQSFTSTEFSILNVGSMALAQIMYLVTMMWQGKLPFDVMTPWDLLLPKKGSVRFPQYTDNTGKETPVQLESLTLAPRVLMVQQAPAAVGEAGATSAAGGKAGAKSDDGAALTALMIDLGCRLFSSFASLFGSAWQIPMLFPKGRIEGFELQQWNNIEGTTPFTSPNINAQRSPLAISRGMQLASSSLGLIAKIVSFCNTVREVPTDVTAHRVLVNLFKLVAVVMNGITLGIRVKKLEGEYPWGLCLAPLGNMIGASPSVIWGLAGPKRTGDWIMLSSTSLYMTSAACDLGTIVLSMKGEQRLKWIPFALSTGFNVSQAGLLVWYYEDYKANH